MHKLLASMVLMLSLLPVVVRAEEPAPAPSTAAQVSPAVTQAQLAAEIFAGTSTSFSSWGSCSFSCEQCVLNTFPPYSSCPPDMYGRPQTCLPECP